ncbi:MAG: hypothetical protein ACK4YO_04010, partial [Candidatus Altarchaeaceae archaeon]
MALEKKQIKEAKKKSKRGDRRFGRRIGKRRKEIGVDLSRVEYVKEFATEEQWIPKTSLGMKVYNGE